jgi:hypothetical protein
MLDRRRGATAEYKRIRGYPTCHPGAVKRLFAMQGVFGV